MSDDLFIAMRVGASGMKAQSTRLRVTSENIANADSVSDVAGGDPYRRKLITFGNALDRASGAQTVEIKSITRDPGDFKLEYQPSHPAADGSGYVKKANVDSLIEMADMREGIRSYEANLRVVDNSRDMLLKTIDLLRT
jgi:flagellar basal-body rod protein FlgC